MNHRRKPPKLKHCKIFKKPFCLIIDSILSYHDWMFTDTTISRIEILPPTLDWLNTMRDNKFIFCVKGFKSPFEFYVWNELRIKQGVSSLSYAQNLVGYNHAIKIIESSNNDYTIPKEETNKAIENNRLIPVTNEIDENKVRYREKLKRTYNKYTAILRRNFWFKMAKKGRVDLLDK